MRINDVLANPRITEKALAKAKGTVYAFEVGMNSTKDQIEAAVAAMFKVKVDSVKTLVKKGKMKRVGKRMKPKKRGDKKIAYVTVKTGKIDVFPES